MQVKARRIAVRAPLRGLVKKGIIVLQGLLLVLKRGKIVVGRIYQDFVDPAC